jgi:vancomycin resistance protein YoaR
MSATTYPIPRSRPLVGQILLSLLFGLLLFVILLIGSIVGYQLRYAGKIFPGVKVAGIDVSGLKPAEASALAQSQFTYPKAGRLLLQDQDKAWLAAPVDLGLYLDPETTASAAYEIGRSGTIGDRLSAQFQAWREGIEIAPVLVFDQRTAFSYLTALAYQVDQPVVEASLSLNGTEVDVRPGQPGRQLDLPASLALITAQVQTLRDGSVPLVVNPTQPAILDASEQADLARRILSEPLTLTLPEGQPGIDGAPWVFDQATLAAMLNIEKVVTPEGKPTFQVTLNSDTLRQFMYDLAPKLAMGPQNARFIFNDDTHQLEVIQSAVIGRELNVENTIQAVQEKLSAGEHSIPLAFDISEPPALDTTTGADLGITELVHAETSWYYGSSADRIQNIKAAASRFHGLLIPPYTTFSMAEALGDISLDNGYAEAMIIIGGQTIKGVGGGVCQVSTTLFRTVFFAGYPIVERYPHAYRVYYYEKVAGNHINPKLSGLDATVFVPIVDFKFTNDTPYWLLMETYVNPGSSSITWKFYSTKDGRSVEWDTTGPTNIVPAPDDLYRENPDLPSGTVKQVDWSADGADVTVVRKVYKDGNLYLDDVIRTHYQPWQAVFEYGPGTPNMPPNSTPPGE